MKPIRILGIDPGFDRLGLAIIEKEGTQETLIFSTCLLSSKKDQFLERLMFLGNEFEKIIKRYTPDHVAIETLFVTKNQKTAMMVAEMRGVLLYLCQKHHLSLFEYSPPQIKMAITGFGKSEKADVAFMVSKILKTPIEKKRLDDEVDAIATALTHSAHYKAFFGKTLPTH